VALILGAGVIVKLVLILLGFFSVVSWGIIFLKFYQINRANSESVRFMDFFWKSKRFDTVASQVDRFANSPLTVLFNEGYGELKKVVDGNGASEGSALSTDLGGVENVSRALRRATNSEITRLEKYLTFLATTGSTSPFIGLFGTVWGIMTSFQSIAASKNTSLAVVAPGIAEALFATAIGLVAAIPATIFYNKFSSEVNKQAQRLELFADEFAAILSRQIDERVG
jgi:biopolymer transport protein TolQ